MKIFQVEKHEVVALWPKVAPWLGRAFSEVDEVEYTLDQLKTMLVSGNQRLLVAISAEGELVGAATVAQVLFPNETVAYITCVGGCMVSNKDVFNQLRGWCKANGFTCIRGAVRESVARLYKRLGFYEKKQRIIEVKI